MVQFIDRPPTPFEELMGAATQGVQGLSQGLGALLGARRGSQERSTLADRFGEEFRNIRDPNLQKSLLQGAIEKENMAAKLAGEYEVDEKSYEQIKNAFGEKFADVWRASPTGARTALTQAALDARARGIDLSDILGDTSQFEEPGFGEGRVQEPLDAESLRRDYTKRLPGFTPREWAQERKEWGKINRKALDEVRPRIAANRRDRLSTKKLQQLNESKKLPEGLERALINPSTGEIYGLAQLAEKASTEAQEWAKEIARFGNRAKDSFGSRVTNFDLQQYLKQFPSLLNTYEGRKNILRMMEINYEMDTLYDQAVQDILDDYEATDIPPEKVDQEARRKIKDRIRKLEDEYLNIERENERTLLNEGPEGGERLSLEEIFG